MRRRLGIAVAALAASAALWAQSGVVHANILPCQGFGGQGAGGYVSSLVQNCLQALGK